MTEQESLLKTDWLIRRHGSNAANQSMTPVMAVGIVSNCDHETAKRVAAENVHCYANQHLELVSFAECDGEEWNDVNARDAELRECGEASIVYDAE